MAEFFPYVVELSDDIDAVSAFVRLAQKPHCVFLDSARRLPALGRYSFLSADPFEIIWGREDDQPLHLLAQRWQSMSQVLVPGLPPFQGGAMGLLSYDLAHSIEAIPRHRFDEFHLPTAMLGIYDVVLAFDHLQDKAWLISQGLPETEPERRSSRAKARADQFFDWLQSPLDGDNASAANYSDRPIPLAGLHATHCPDVYSNFDAESYRHAIRQVVEYIHAGDVFQVNLAQRLTHRATRHAVPLYLDLRARNPAPFAAYFDLGDSQIVSASPERFLQARDGQVQARPIKGTRQRTLIPEADLFGAEELKASSKDVSENVMIVDLMRNDLSRVCEDDSVVVTQLCGLESYEFVQHLVSVVEGRLRERVSPVDLIRATFPGGSITGAPKVRAMQIIAELEPTARGPYCGSLGYIGFDGTMDLNILIRTITASRGWWQFPVGGGIVAHSDPDNEYDETWHKAEGLLRAVLAPA